MAERQDGYRRALIALLLAIHGLVVCTSTAASAPAASSGPAADGAVFALLADSRLVTVRVADGAILATHRLVAAPPPEVTRSPGHLLALSRDGRTLFALVPGWDARSGQAGDEVDQVVAVDVATTRVTARHRLPESGGVYRSLAVGPRTGTLYLFGNRAGAVVVATLDPTTGAQLAAWTAREAEGRGWDVFQGAVSPDERALFVSYHSATTTGVDRFDLTAEGSRRCPASERPGFGCIWGHGGFALSGDGLLVATGSEVVVIADATGQVTGAVDTGLVRNHLVEFAVDAEAGRLYAVGPCDYAGGFSAVDLDGAGTPILPTAASGGEWGWQSAPAPPVVLLTWDTAAAAAARQGIPCGTRQVLAPGPVLVVARTGHSAVVAAGAPGILLFIDTTTGQTIRSVKVPAEPSDLVAIPSG